MERGRRVQAVCAGIGQRADHVEKLDERAWPAMSQQQRNRMALRRSDVQKMHLGPVDFRDELWVAVQLRLGGTPVVFLAPVPHKLSQVAKGHAAFPASAVLVRPSRTVEP